MLPLPHLNRALRQVLAGASRIIAVDVIDEKLELAKKWGATDVINSSKVEVPIQQHIVSMTGFGVDYSFDCTGNVKVKHPVGIAMKGPMVDVALVGKVVRVISPTV